MKRHLRFRNGIWHCVFARGGWYPAVTGRTPAEAFDLWHRKYGLVSVEPRA